MGSELPDADLYHHSHLDGGLAYTPESLRWIFSHLTEVELRRMRDEPPESPPFRLLESAFYLFTVARTAYARSQVAIRDDAPIPCGGALGGARESAEAATLTRAVNAGERGQRTHQRGGLDPTRACRGNGQKRPLPRQ